MIWGQIYDINLYIFLNKGQELDWKKKQSKQQQLSRSVTTVSSYFVHE